MPIDIRTLVGYLEEEGLIFDVGRDGGAIYVPFSGAMVICRVVEDGGGLLVYAPNVFMLERGEFYEAALQYMADHNYRVKIGVFGYDPRDGECHVAHFLPVEDGTVTRRQFIRLVRVIASVAREQGSQLMQVAFGKEPREPQGSVSLPAELQRLLDQVIADADRSRGGPADLTLPDEPVDESTWMRHVAVAFRALCGDAEETASVERMRREMWPRLRDLRQRSIEAGHNYRSQDLAAQLGLSSEEEYLLLFMVARQMTGDTRIFSKEIDLVYSPGLDEAETRTLIERLRSLGVIEDCDHDGLEPFRLSRRYLDALADVLPFEHRTLPAPVGADDLPQAPVSEQEWLQALQRAAEADLFAIEETDRVERFRTEVWPALLQLRADSSLSGQRYETAIRAAECGLSDAEEMVVAYVAACAADGNTRVQPMAIDVVYSPGLDVAETIELLRRLTDLGLLRSSDNDGLPPHTLGERGRPWLAN